ncbi:TPA: hypothetical protein N0F65_005054 [Lagenidium giganteum]|uniref:HECT-type E3 ubiquitin transferase n=1 Tax=Lagenidium giganteum TaxID=4803 RepID=A0AAV2ZLG5_9STRA|nr:TPA: hypothetical protein N0F65_005054 [Lagenidium giganteum]
MSTQSHHQQLPQQSRHVRESWVRRQDANGELFWFRTVVPAEGIAASSSLAFSLRLEAVAKAEAIMNTEALPRKDDRPRAALAQEARSVTTELVRTAADSTAFFPLANKPMSRADKHELVRLASQDFPTKYAHFVVCTAELTGAMATEVLKLSIHRRYAVEESLEHLACVPPQHLRSTMHVRFFDEHGIDAGGIQREWLQLLNEEMVDPALALFVRTNPQTQTYYFNPHVRHFDATKNDEYLFHYYATGRLMGRCLLEGGVWGFHLAAPLLKLILGQPLQLTDIEGFDPALFRSLTWMLEHDGAESLGLTFTTCECTQDGRVVEEELIPGGANIEVNDSNKREYVERQVQYLLVERVAPQMYAFLKGVYQVLPHNLLALFHVDELDFVLCGTDELNVDDWERHTKASSCLTGSEVWEWFFRTLREMPSDYRRRLLQFATGASRVPVGGFKNLTSHDGQVCPFTLKAIPYDPDQPFIRAHACFNRIDLPMFPTEKDLKMMVYMVLNTDLYGFSID